MRRCFRDRARSGQGSIHIFAAIRSGEPRVTAAPACTRERYTARPQTAAARRSAGRAQSERRVGLGFLRSRTITRMSRTRTGRRDAPSRARPRSTWNAPVGLKPQFAVAGATVLLKPQNQPGTAHSLHRLLHQRDSFGRLVAAKNHCGVAGAIGPFLRSRKGVFARHRWERRASSPRTARLKHARLGRVDRPAVIDRQFCPGPGRGFAPGLRP